MGLLDVAIQELLMGNQNLNQSIVDASTIRAQDAQFQLQQQQRKEDQFREDRVNAQQRQYDVQDQATNLINDRINSLSTNMAFLDNNDPLRQDILAATDYLIGVRSQQGDAALSAAITGKFMTQDGRELNINTILGDSNRKAEQYRYGLSQEQANREASRDEWERMFNNFQYYSNQEDAKRVLQAFADSPSTDPAYAQRANDLLKSEAQLVGDSALELVKSQVTTAQGQAQVATVQGNIAVATQDAVIEYENLAPEERQTKINNVVSATAGQDAKTRIDESTAYVLEQTQDIAIESEELGLVSKRLANQGAEIDNQYKRVLKDAAALEYSENLLTTEGRVALINKQNVNGITISDQEVTMGALQIDIGGAELNIKLQAYEIGDLQKKRMEMENNVAEYTNARDFIVDAVTLGNTAMLDKLRLEQQYPGTFPELSDLADSITGAEIEQAYTKARTTNYIFQNEQQLTLRQIAQAAQDLSIEGVAKKSSLMQQLGNLYTPEELDVLFQSDPTLKAMLLEGTLGQADVSAAKTMAGVQQTLIKQEINAPQLKALEGTILTQYQKAPPAGQEVAYTQGLVSALNQYAELLGMPPETASSIVNTITAGYQNAWANENDFAALEKAQLTAQTLLIGAQTELAYANAADAYSSAKYRGASAGAKEASILDLSRMYDLKVGVLDDKLGQIGEGKKVACELRGGVPVNAEACNSLTAEENYYFDLKLQAMESLGIETPGLKSQGRQYNESLEEYTSIRYPMLYQRGIDRGMSQSEAEEYAITTAVREGQAIGQGDPALIYNNLGQYFPTTNFQGEVFTGGFDISPNPAFDRQNQNQQGGEWGFQNWGPNLRQAGQSIADAPGQIGRSVGQVWNDIFNR